MRAVYKVTNQERPKSDVCREIVANNLCIGCGLCAAICPRQNLRIKFNQYGEYTVRQQGEECPDGCTVCLDTCPFFGGAENESTLGKKLFAEIPGIKYASETGYYLEAFVGYSNIAGHREMGGSGGMATWMLETLLTQKLVDYVACVSAANEPGQLFKYGIYSVPEEVRGCSQSCYYPVETSQIIRQVLSKKGRYAIIALPCVCKGIRLAMQLNPKLARRVKFLLGLVCGQVKSKFFAEYVCALAGGEADSLRKVIFRVKEPNRAAWDFGMKFICASSSKVLSENLLFWSEGINLAWGDRLFTPNACDFCDDVFAEVADVCFMDAWLPQYSSDWRGHSIVLVRHKELSALLKGAIQNESVYLKPLDIGQVVKSQSGVLLSKRSDIRERIRLAKKGGMTVPAKRLSLCGHEPSMCRRFFIREQRRISKNSREMWPLAETNLPKFVKMMGRFNAGVRLARLLWKIEYIIRKALQRLRG